MNDDNKKKNDDDNNKKRHSFLAIATFIMIAIFAIAMITRNWVSSENADMSYNEFLNKIETTDVSKIDRVVIDATNYRVTLVVKDANRTTEYSTGIVEDIDEFASRLMAKGITVESLPVSNPSILLTLLIYCLPLAIFIFFMSRTMGKNGGLFGLGKSNAKLYMQKETGVTFADVAGQDEAEDSLQEIVDFLHDPGKYTAIGAKLPKGALLVGPPGTGKTLLAKAVAGEAKVPFFSLAGSDFVEMFVGLGASRVRDLFKNAEEQAPCIIFIDEIDAIGKSRDNRFGGNDEREQTLNALLSEMDGFDSSKGVFILAATNRPEVLDPALLRPGRFDRRIIVDRPDLKGRRAVLDVHSKGVKMDESVDLDAIALATAGSVGSDLANMINEAAILAAKNKRKAVSQADLFESVEMVIAGKEKKDRVMNEKERRMVAFHEVGHALASALQKNTEPVQKITIVPRTMGSLGYVMQTPEEEKFLMTKAELEAELVSLLSGRAAEEIFFDSVSTGASNDIERATNLARDMIAMYGMSEEFGLMALSTVRDEYLTGQKVMNCADETVAKIDAAVKAKLAASYEKAKELLSENKEILEKIASFLIEKETITGKEFMQILHDCQNESEEASPANVPELTGEA